MANPREAALTAMLKEAQARPGVADLMRVYSASQARIEAAHRPQAVRHVVTTASANIKK